MNWENFIAMLPYGVTGAVVLGGLTLLIRWVWSSFSPNRIEARGVAEEAAYLLEPGRRPPTMEEIDAIRHIHQQDSFDQYPHCPCGEIATHPLPMLVRERLDGNQSRYASAPKYRREVPKTSYLWGFVQVAHEEMPEPRVCEAHAHYADAKMDHFIFMDIRAEQAKTNEKIAQRAADFETEKLLQSIKDSLTEDQKKKVRSLQQKTRQQPLQVANGGAVSERPANSE